MTGHTMGVCTVCFSPDGKRLLSAAPDNTLRLWDVETGKEVKRIASNAYAVQQRGTPICAAFSPDGARIASGSEDDNFLRFWDAATGKLVRAFETPARVRSVAFFPDGKRIATAGEDGIARVWRAPR
jgi:WD40 repeat protein